MATSKTVYLYAGLGSNAPWFSVVIPVTELPNLEAAIQAGSWYKTPANPNEHWNMAGVTHYVVTS